MIRKVIFIYFGGHVWATILTLLLDNFHNAIVQGFLNGF